MGKGYRQGRLGEEIRRVISSMLISRIKDPRLSSMISISAVDVTADGSYATCYISALKLGKNEEEKAASEKEILEGLESASGLMKKEIGRQIRLRRVPQLIFKMDHSMDYGEHIDSILSTMDFDSYQKDEEDDGEDTVK